MVKIAKKRKFYPYMIRYYNIMIISSIGDFTESSYNIAI